MVGVMYKGNSGSAKKHKNKNIGTPILVKKYSPTVTGQNHTSIEKFIKSTNAEEQLGVLRNIFEGEEVSIEDGVVQFLAVVFYEAPAKHPVKSYLSKHITRCMNIQECFIHTLTAHITSEISNNLESDGFVYYSERIPKILLCIENFPSGALALEAVRVNLITEHLFFNYFAYRKELRNSTLSPTKKNEMLSLEHTLLRLIIYVIQKLDLSTIDGNEKEEMAVNIMTCVNSLICDEEVSMDTKSLAGILILAAENLRRISTDSWKFPLQTAVAYSKTTESSSDSYYQVLRQKIGQLAVYSAVATTVPMEQLQEALTPAGPPAVLVLIDELSRYADGSASAPAVAVCVMRAFLQLSRALGGAGPAGGEALARLLPALWTLLDYPLDSVRHLADQTLAACLQYSARLDRCGDSGPLDALLRSVRALGECRSRYWAAASCAASAGAARVLRDLCGPPALLRAAAAPHLQAAASAAISALIRGGACAGLPTREVFRRWVQPALGQPAALRAVLPALLEADPDLAQYIWSETRGDEALACARAAPAGRARLPPGALRAAALHPDDEKRILALSLVSEAGRGSEPASREDLDTALWFLTYNLGAPGPGFRTAMLGHLQKLFRRLSDSRRALARAGALGSVAHYCPFVEEVRRLCYCGLLPGAAHARRTAALQILAAVEETLPDFPMAWRAAHARSLLHHLDDSYDGNKAAALRVLQHCPLELLEECTPELSLDAVVSAACSLRAARGACAAARLQLLLSRLPHRVRADTAEPAAVGALRALLATLRAGSARPAGPRAAAGGGAGALRCVAAVLRDHTHEAEWDSEPWATLARELTEQCLEACSSAEPIVSHHAPEGYLPEYLLSEGSECSHVTAQMVLVSAWRAVKEAAGALGLLAARGGALPAGRGLLRLLQRAMHRGAVEQAAVGLGNVAHYCWGEESLAHLPRQWTRELLAQVARGAPHATRRGAGLPAAIQALVSSEVSATGRAECFNECMAELLKLATNTNFNDKHTDKPTDVLNLTSNGDYSRDSTDSSITDSATTEVSTDAVTDAVTATTKDRSAHGITASTESVTDSGNIDAATDFSTTDEPTDSSTTDSATDAMARRTLAANILRALYRHTTLEKVSQPYVGVGLRLALQGFEAVAWPERTAMSLLFCALCVRAFGVARARGPALHARNTLPAPVFFQRYPALHDLMLRKLEEFDLRAAAGPGALPVLLLLARLRPGARAQVSPFARLAQRCAGAAEHHVRRLAARALPALLPPAEYIPYAERLFAAASEPNLQHNHWHGALLTLTSLLERAPAPVTSDNGPVTSPSPKFDVTKSMHALTQALGPRPCYVVAREYASVLNLLIWKFPAAVPKETLVRLREVLDEVVFRAGAPAGAERGPCLADCALLYLVVLHREKQFNKILPLINRTLLHSSYEVVLSSLDYLLIQRDAHADLELCNFRQHLLELSDNEKIYPTDGTADYMNILTKLTGCYNDPGKYIECRIKSLQLLTLEENTQALIINEIPPKLVDRDSWIARKLIAKVEDSHDNTKHLFLNSLLQFAKEKYEELGAECLVGIHQVMYDCCPSDSSEECRLAVVGYLETAFVSKGIVLDYESPIEEFLDEALLVSALVTLLEDDDDVIRQRAAAVAVEMAHTTALPPDDGTSESSSSLASAASTCGAGGGGVVASAAGELVRRRAAARGGAPTLLLLALLDFRAEVTFTDDVTDECRVFDQSERYNILLEESVWTDACADQFIEIIKTGPSGRPLHRPHRPLEHALRIVRSPLYGATFQKLCNDNLKLFETMAAGDFVADETVNPKIEILVRKLQES